MPPQPTEAFVHFISVLGGPLYFFNSLLVLLKAASDEVGQRIDSVSGIVAVGGDS